MKLEGSKTEMNLLAAFAGESQASTKYRFYASRAKKDGYEQIANIFTETADNEKEHAEIWFKKLHGGEMTDTVRNLHDAAAGEHYEWSEMYKNFAETAREEGFDEIAFLFDSVAAIEKTHDARYMKLIENIEKNIVFSRGENTVWICRNCGHIHVGKTAPLVCPTCEHPQSYFEIRCENY